MSGNRVVVAEMGAVTLFSLTVDRYWQELVNGEPAISLITIEPYKPHLLKDNDEEIYLDIGI
jgi:hypothetical protein